MGRIAGGRFVVEGRLADLGVPIETTAETGGQLFSKQRGMRSSKAILTAAQANSVDLGAEIQLQASTAFSWAFCAVGARQVAIKNILEVNRLVVEAQKAGTWDSGWQLVTEIWRVDRLTVLVARAKDVSATVKAKGTVAEPLDVLVEATATYEYNSDDFFCVPNATNVSPLYGLRKLKGWIDPKLKPIGSGTALVELSLEPAREEPFF